MKKKMNKIFILLILTSIFTLRIYAHDLTDMPGPHLSFEEYLSKVRKSNLGYLAVQMNVDIAEAEAVSMSVFGVCSLTQVFFFFLLLVQLNQNFNEKAI